MGLCGSYEEPQFQTTPIFVRQNSLSEVLTKLAELTTHNRPTDTTLCTLLFSPWTFLAFLVEQEIHYPSVDYSDHNE